MSVSLNYTGSKTFRHPVSGNRRSYFHITMKTLTAVLKFGGGDGEILIPENDNYVLCGTAANTKIQVITEGTYVVHSDNHDELLVNTTALFSLNGVLTCSGTLSCEAIIPCGG